MREFDLKRLQNLELQILKDVAKFCDDNGIVYFLDSGTLLGAVRHGGFIPWDDDIDICMDLRNYKKFCKLAPKGLPSQYFVQNFHTEPKTNINWTKVRLNGTTSMERNSTNYDVHYGICIDIFVKVGLAESKIGKKVQSICGKYMTILLAKYRYIALGEEMYPKFILVYRILPEFIRRLCINILEKFAYLDTTKKSKCFNTWYSYNPQNAKEFPASMYDDNARVLLQFDGEEFWAPEKYIQYLEIAYGDWKTPPSEAERYGHGDIIVDFEKDYKYYYTGKK